MLIGGVVAVAQPLLGLGARNSRSLLPWRRIACTCLECRAIGRHDRLERGVQVGADPGRDGGALARIEKSALTPASEPGAHLAEVLVDRLDVWAALLDREGDDQPAGGITRRCRGARTRPAIDWNCWRQRPGTTAFRRWIADWAPR